MNHRKHEINVFISFIVGVSSCVFDGKSFGQILGRMLMTILLLTNKHSLTLSRAFRSERFLERDRFQIRAQTQNPNHKWLDYCHTMLKAISMVHV